MEAIKIAGIQMHSKSGAIAENQLKAQLLIEEAATQGANMVFLPELFSCGYMPSKEIWQYAESVNGKTARFISSLAMKHGIYIGAGLIEKSEGHYWNSYIVSSPQGAIEGRAVKEHAEAYVFKTGRGKHIIKTAAATIGIGICADNHYTSFIKKMRNENIDLMVMPHASPMPYRISQGVSAQDIEKSISDAEGFAPLVTQLLGIPAIYINQTGELYPMTGILGKMITGDSFHLGGRSGISQKDGKIISSLEQEEGIVIGSVELSDGLKPAMEIPDYNGWIQEGSKILRNFIIPLDIAAGKLYYNMKRKVS